jgi:hypothetical protein
MAAAPMNSRSSPCQWHRCRVVQLTARDEHRQHYPLTSVAPPFTEIALPGVHANIGGGYNQLEEGPKLLSRPRRQQLPRRRCRLPDATAGDAAGPPPTLKRRPMPSAGGSSWAWTKGVWVDVWHQWQQQRRAGSRSVLLSPVLYVTPPWYCGGASTGATS